MLRPLLHVASYEPRDLRGCCLQRNCNAIKKVHFQNADVAVTTKHVRQCLDRFSKLIGI